MRALVVTAVGVLVVLAGLVLFDWRAAVVAVGVGLVWVGLVADWGD